MLALTQAYRTTQARHRAATLAELLLLWPLLDPDRLDETLLALTLAVRGLVLRAREQSSQQAMDYLQVVRDDAGVPGPALLVPASRVPAGLVDTAVRVTSTVTIKQGVARGQSRAVAAQTAFVRTSGAIERLVSDGGRHTVTRSVAADPHAEGWRRITSPGACDFCQLLAGRGAVYKATTSTFRSHDHCGCTAEPVYRS